MLVDKAKLAFDWPITCVKLSKSATEIFSSSGGFTIRTKNKILDSNNQSVFHVLNIHNPDSPYALNKISYFSLMEY